MKPIRKNILYLSILAVACVGLFPILSYIVNGILDRAIKIEDFQKNLNFGYFFDLFMSKEVHLSYYAFNPINIGLWAIIGYGILMILFSSFGPKEKDQFEQKEEYASHGTSRFQREDEINKNYYEDKREGWFLGSNNEYKFKLGMSAAVHAIENFGKLNGQINVVGPPGSDKTTGFVYPNMFYIPFAYRNSEDKPDIIVTDPKGEILSYTGRYLTENNYEVKIIDFLHLKYGDTVNPLAYIEEEEDIMKIATGFVGAAAMKNAKSQNADPIWEQGEGLLLAALISFVLEVYPPEEQSFETVRTVLSSPVMRDFEESQKLFQRHNIKGYGEKLWNNFLNLEDKLRTGVVGGLTIKMTLFALSKVQRITGTNSFNFEDIGRKKDKPLAIFIQMPDEDRTYSPIINTIISMMIKTMYSTARETNSRLPNPVYMILEEIANIGRLPGIEELLGTMRGRRIYPMMIWQDLVQMKSMFGEAWDGIIAKCDTQVFLGVNDQTTAKYVSEKLGKTTIKTQGTSSKAGGIMSSPGESQSQSYSQRQLLFPDEVEGFDNSKLIMKQRSRHPVVLNKTQYKFWESFISEPLTLDELPLLSRFDVKVNIEKEQSENEIEPILFTPEEITPITEKELIEPITPIIEVEQVEETTPDNITTHEDMIVDLNTGEILIDEVEMLGSNTDELEFDFDIQMEVENDFEFENHEQEFVFDLPNSEFDKE